MHVLGVVGTDDADATPLLDALASRLGEDGTVAVVSRTVRSARSTTAPPDEPGLDGVTTRVEVSNGWHRRTTTRDAAIDDVLERLAPDHDFALIEDADATGRAHVIYDPSGTATESSSTDSNPLAVVESVDEAPVAELVHQLKTVEPFETLESLVARIKQSPGADRAGAIATFTGRVRAKDSPDDEWTEYLEFEKYEGVADRRMRAIESELEAREGVLDVRLHHRTGVVEAGEDIVFVVVLAGHRQEAFATVEDGINRLKDEVPLFKKEVTTDETFWVHERD